jgi:polysaccharide export outer membrane protein
MLKRISQLLAGILFLSACLISPAFAQGREFLRTRSGSVASDATPLSGDEVKYFIASGDEIEVFVWKNPDLSKVVIVDPDGRISYPLVGRIKVSGLSIEELEKQIQERISEYVISPQVSLMMRKFSGNKIIVLGEVTYPGIYTYTGAINLIEAVGLAGDFTDQAHSESVIVVRGNLKENPQVMRINMIKAITRGTSDSRIILQPNDVIFIPKTFVANLNKFINDIGPIIGTATSSIDLRQQIRRINHRDDFSGTDAGS